MNDSDKELIPVQLTPDSQIEFVTKQEAANIIINELNYQREYFESLPDNDKEEYLSKIILEQVKTNKSILDSEVMLCTLNNGIFTLLQFFYIPDKISKTIASWIAWFLRGLGKITWAFLSQSVLYVLTHWQRLCLLIFLALVVFPNLSFAKAAADNKIDKLVMNDLSDIGPIQELFTNFANNIPSTYRVTLLFYIKDYLLYAVLAGVAYTLYDFMNQLLDSIKKINANCLSAEDDITNISMHTKEKIRNQLDSALNDLKKSSVIRKGISQSRQLKQNPISNEQFVQHVQSIVETTPVQQILGTPLTDQHPHQLDIANPDNVTQDQYNQGIVQYSLGLEKHSDDLHFITTPTPEEPPIVFIGANDDESGGSGGSDTNININTNPEPDKPIDGVSQTLGESIKFILSTS